MQNYYFDNNGVYTHALPAHDGTTPPANAIRTAPLEKSGYVAVLNKKRDGWTMVEDHRGDQGYVDGEYRMIKTVGPLPDGWSTTPPEMPDTRTAEEKRKAAYIARSDPILAEANGYATRAVVLKANGDDAAAAEAQKHHDEKVAEWWEVVTQIQAEYPE